MINRADRYCGTCKYQYLLRVQGRDFTRCLRHRLDRQPHRLTAEYVDKVEAGVWECSLWEGGKK